MSLPRFHIVEGQSLPAGVIQDVGYAPALADYYFSDLDDAGTHTGKIQFFDASGKVLGSNTFTAGAASDGGVTIAASIGGDLPTGAVGALLTAGFRLACSVGASFDATSVVPADMVWWEVAAGENIPLGLVPINLGISQSSWGGGGAGGTESVVDLWRYCVVSDVAGAAVYVDLMDSDGATVNADFRIGGLADTAMTIATAMQSATPVGLVWSDAFVTLKVVSVVGNAWFNTAAADTLTITAGEEPTSASERVLPGMVWGLGAPGGAPFGGTSTEGYGPLDLGKAEDSAHASGDVGVMTLAVRKDTAAATAADGDYHPLLVDSTGALHVNAGTSGRIAKDLFDTEGTFTIATASNALAVNCGATAAQVDFTDADGNAPSAIKVFASFACNTGSAVGAGEHIDLYWISQDENVAPFSLGGGGTTDAALNASNTLLLLAKVQDHYLGSAYVGAGTSQVGYWEGVVEHPGPRGTILYVNHTAQALAASGSYIRYRPIHTEAI